MADFQARVQGLTQLTMGSGDAPSTAELTEFLKDGVLDVTSRWLAVRPQDAELFQRESSPIENNGDIDLKGATVISVMRENEADGSSDGSTAWRPCNKIPPSMQSQVVDTESLSFASKYHPVYTIIDFNEVHVYPTPDGTNDSFKVFYVNHIPKDLTNSADLDCTHSDIKYFPANKVYLVALYASIQSLQAALANSVISLSITSPTAPSASVLNSPGIATTSKAAIDGNVPTYTKPVMDARTAFTNFSSGITITDPGTLTITSVAPVPPADPSFSAPGTISTTISNIGTPPTYTAPSITSTAGSPDDLTDMINSDWTDLDYDFADENMDFATWFQAAGDMIQNQQDTELAASQLQKISTYINAYSTAMQNQLHKFNDANVEYQAKLQEATRQADIDSRDSSQTKSLLLQKEHQEYTVKLQKYGSEVSKYQAEVNTEVQAKQTNLSQYSAELTTSLQAWQKEQSDKIQQYQSDIQNALNEFNKENVKYQANIQAEITKAQIDAQEYQKEGDMALQASITEYANNLQRYQAEVADYQAEVTKEIQESTTKVQQYQLLYTQLKQQYDAAFGIAAPQQQGAR